MLRLFFLLVLATILPVTLKAGFDEGGAAYKRGDFEMAAKEFIPLADRGDHRAMYALGSMYAAGLGVDKDLDKAYALFHEAALNGRIDAMYKLGLMYEQGLGVEQNYRQALRYYQRSARQGYPLSQYRFGLMYANGKGVKANPVTAYAWLVIAGHYFIYESGKSSQITHSDMFEEQIRFVQQQEIEKITNALIDELQALRSHFTEADIADVRRKVIDYSKYKKRYHSASVRYVKPDGKIENMFLPETLY